MRREARLLLRKALDSLVVGVEHFNRADERGRVSTVLILLDHSFEMLLKASILHRGGKIREPRARETIGFDACVRRGHSDANVKFLTAEQALTLQTINGLRDAAQHHLISISEQQLYLHAQSGVTLFRDLLKSVFKEDLVTYLPARVLPIATLAPADLTALFETEATEITKLLQPGRRRKTEAYARLRPLAILDATILGEKLQPADRELRACAEKLNQGLSWNDIFLGAASVHFSVTGSGPSIALRLTKKEGIPVQLVPEGTPGASVVGVKRVSELDFYNLGRDGLAEHLGLSTNKTTAAIWCLDLQSDPDCFKQVAIGKVKFKRYSQRAIERIQRALANEPIDRMWLRYKEERLRGRQKQAHG
jgi:hypothetical protein